MSRTVNTLVTGLAVIAIFFVATWAVVQFVEFMASVLRVYG